jgi:dTDP-4-amino-4,6-dideoxygalactose transaminase
VSLALERRLSDYLGRPAFLTGHGTTAIGLALKAIESRVGTGEVILPSIGCASIAQVVSYAGFTPRFIDINLSDYTLDIDALRAAITPAARAVMPVHIFGHACDMTSIMAIAGERGLYVIEDAAQGLGGQYQGRKLGSIGHFGVLSFGGSKILSAGAGGALLVSDGELAEVVERERANLPAYDRSPQIALKSLSHRNLYHGAVDLLRATGAVHVEGIFQTAAPLYRDLYFHRFPDDATASRIEAALDDLERNLADRLHRAALYRELLANLPVRQTGNWESSRSLWRYTFMLATPQQAIHTTERLRHSHIHASNHYWSLADLFLGDKSLPNTGHFCPRVLNLWVDDIADDAYIETSCRVIAESLQ